MLTAPQKAYMRHLVNKHHDPEGMMNDREYAEFIGVHYNTLANWRNSGEFQDALKKADEEYEKSSDYFKTCMRHHVLEQGWIEYQRSKGAERRKWWSQLVKETADADIAGDTIDYSQVSDDDLVAMCLAREVSPAGMSMAELRAYMRKEKGADRDSDTAG